MCWWAQCAVCRLGVRWGKSLYTGSHCIALGHNLVCLWLFMTLVCIGACGSLGCIGLPGAFELVGFFFSGDCVVSFIIPTWFFFTFCTFLICML